MIPRLKPSLDLAEIRALFKPQGDAVAEFERMFARTFQTQDAIAYPYGRSALWAMLKAIGVCNSEVILPAYTCSVVAHAIVLSGNYPRFVDINLHDYNMNLDEVERAITVNTRVVIATHLFGYPLDVDRLQAIVRSAESRYGRKIYVVQDCAHSFGAYRTDRLVCNVGDVALFGLNISKTITSIFGGMLTTNDVILAGKLREWRDVNFKPPGFPKTLRRQLYLLMVTLAFNERVYSFVNWLQNHTPLLNYFTRTYHLDDKIHFPPDYQEMLLPVEARVGQEQLSKYEEIVQRRQENAQYYAQHIPTIPGWEFPPLIEGATYSHYVIRVPDRERVIEIAKKRGVQLGELIEYSVPHTAAYSSYIRGEAFPNSLFCSQHTINLPIYPSLTRRQQDHILQTLVECGKPQ